VGEINDWRMTVTLQHLLLFKKLFVFGPPPSFSFVEIDVESIKMA